MTRSTEPKTALVTGASQGIGAAIAEALAASGAQVVVNFPFASEAEKAQQVVGRIESAGGRAVAVKADVTKAYELESLFAAAEEQFGQLDIIVSNAGGDARIVPIVETTEADYDRTTNLNAKAAFFTLQHAAKRVRDGGRIIAISSSTPSMPYVGCAVYAGAKAATEIYAKVLAKELGPRGVTVNIVSPGPTDTETMRNTTPEDAKSRAIGMTPLGRLGEPVDIADVVAFVASDEARWLTAQNIRACGGLVSS